MKLLRAKFSIDERICRFRVENGIANGQRSNSNCIQQNNAYKVEPMQLTTASSNPHFYLPNRDQLTRLFMQTVTATEPAAKYPFADFLYDIYSRQVQVLDDFMFTQTLFDLGEMYRKPIELVFAGNPILASSDKTAKQLMTIRLLETCLLTKIYLSTLSDENPFEDAKRDDDLDDIVDELSIDYAVAGKVPSEDLVDYFCRYRLMKI